MHESVAEVKEELPSLQLTFQEARNGDRHAFDQLIRMIEKKVMKTAFYMTGNLDDAQDVAQEVYVKIFRKLEDAGELEKPSAWVHRITVNTAHDLHRRRRRWLPLEELATVFRPGDPVVAGELRNRLMQSLERLSFKERAAFIFKELHELETAEIARILSCQEVTVRGFLHSARKKLQKSLRHMGGVR